MPELPVMGDQGQSFLDGLRDEHSIKGILVVGR
jgi:hypothetical protein